MKYVIKMNELNDFSSSFKDYCNKELLTSIDNLFKEFNKIEWEGENKNLYEEELSKKIAYLKRNLDNLYFFAYFYKIVGERYKEANSLSMKEFAKIKEELLEIKDEMENDVL